MSIPLLLRPRMLLAGLLLSAIGSAVPAAAAIDPYGADLSLSMSESTSQVTATGAITYGLTIHNTWFVQGGCDVDRHGHPICTPDRIEPGPIQHVAVQDHLPAGATLISTSNDAGFTCFQDLWGILNCNNGSIPASGVATITLTVHTPNLPAGGHATLTNCATVDPLQTIDERDYTNNSACASAMEVALTPTVTPR